MDQLTELARRLDNMIRSGTIAAVDHDADLCRVKTGRITTGWLRWFVRRAGSTRDWDPVSIGEQCVVLSPGGDLAQGFVLVGLHSDANPAPADSESLCRREYPDGAVIDYDHASHSLSVTLPAGGTAALTAPGGVTITGDVQINGHLGVSAGAEITGTLTASDDVQADGISLIGHTHPGDSGGTTGGPQ